MLAARRKLYMDAGRSLPFEVYIVLEALILASAMALVFTIAFDRDSAWVGMILLGATTVHHFWQLWRNPIRVFLFGFVGMFANIFAIICGASQPLLWAVLMACIVRLIEGEYMVHEEAAARAKLSGEDAA